MIVYPTLRPSSRSQVLGNWNFCRKIFSKVYVAEAVVEECEECEEGGRILVSDLRQMDRVQPVQDEIDI